MEQTWVRCWEVFLESREQRMKHCRQYRCEDGRIGVEISETHGPGSTLGFLGGRFEDDS